MQNAIRQQVKSPCQVHSSFLWLDPDPDKIFKVLANNIWLIYNAWYSTAIKDACLISCEEGLWKLVLVEDVSYLKAFWCLSSRFSIKKQDI